MAFELHAACTEGQTGWVEECLDRGEDIEAWDDEGRTPLDLAVRAGNTRGDAAPRSRRFRRST